MVTADPGASTTIGNGAGRVDVGRPARGDPDRGGPPPAGTDDVVHRRRWLTLGAMCLSLLIIIMDNTILNVALPSLSTDLGANTSELQWIVDAYTIVFAGLLLTAGSLGDKHGRRRSLVLGLLIFGAGSVLSSHAGSPGLLIATRCVMGLGGAFIMPATLSIITNVFRDPAERAKAIGIWAGISGLGIAIGPVTGGYLLEHFYWGSIFLINVPIVLVAVLCAFLLVPETRDPSAPPVDLEGALLSIGGLVLLLWGIIEAPDRGWADELVVGAIAGGLAVVALFVVWELHAAHPMLEIRFFANPRFSAANVSITMIFFALLGSLFLLTQFLQDVQDYTALEAGVRTVPFAVAIGLASPISSLLDERFGTKAVVAAGMVLVAVGLALFSFVEVDTGYGYVVLAMVVMSAGMGLAMAPATDSIMGALPRAKAGVGSAMNDTTREVGGALGVAIIGSIVSSGYTRRLSAAISDAGQQVPAPALDAAEGSIAAAVDVGGQVGGAAGAQLVEAARSSFVDGFGTGMLFAAGISAAAALAALLFLPARATCDPDGEEAAPRDGAVTGPVEAEVPAGRVGS